MSRIKDIIHVQIGKMKTSVLKVFTFLALTIRIFLKGYIFAPSSFSARIFAQSSI